MKKELFELSDVNAGLNLIVMSYFDRMYEDGKFMKAMDLLSKKWTLNTDGAYCHFPDMDSFDVEDHFEGVEIAIGYPPTEEDTVIVDENTFYHYVRLACERYLKLHPEDKEMIDSLLLKMPA